MKSYRMTIYENFSLSLRNSNILWVVVHGIDEYPNDIGRDLDVLCKSDYGEKYLIDLFSKICRENKQTKFLIFPKELWGFRVVSISSKFEVAELHILNRLNSGLISFKEDFKKIVYKGNFPFSYNSYFFKAVLMPLLAGNKKILKYKNSVYWNLFPLFLKKRIINFEKKGKISFNEKIAIYFHYNKNIFNLFNNLIYSLKLNIKRLYAFTVPIFSIDDSTRIDDYYSSIKEFMLEKICADNLSNFKIRKYCSRQVFVYTTKDIKIKNKIIKIDLSHVSKKDFAFIVAKSFSEFYNYKTKEAFSKES